MNRSEHLTAGGICGFFLPEILERFGIYVDRDIASRIKYAAHGAFGGILPDILEPATNPQHREFFHSILVGGGTIIGLTNGNQNLEMLKQNPLFLALVVGYFSHLFLDSLSESGLPLY